MKPTEMVELVRQHHPGMGETEILKMLNKANREMMRITRIKRLDYDILTNYATCYDATNGYVSLGTYPGGVVVIKDVYIDGEPISQLTNPAYVGETGSGDGCYYWWRDEERLYIVYNGATITVMPDSVTSCSLRYISNTSALTIADSTGPDYNEQFHDALPYYAIARGYELPENMNIQVATYFKAQYREILREAKKYSRRRGMTGVVQPHAFNRKG